MKFVQKLAMGLDCVQAHHAILRQGGLWTGNTIPLRSAEGNHLAFDMLPQLRQFIFGIMAKVEGEELGEVRLCKVEKGQEVTLTPSLKFQRYILPIYSLPGAILSTGPESLMLISGDVLWILGELGLTITNNSQDDLVVLEVLARPNSPAELP
jgi:hypothetical protein